MDEFITELENKLENARNQFNAIFLKLSKNDYKDDKEMAKLHEDWCDLAGQISAYTDVLINIRLINCQVKLDLINDKIKDMKKTGALNEGNN